jgi:hypothetical protein
MTKTATPKCSSFWLNLNILCTPKIKKKYCSRRIRTELSETRKLFPPDSISPRNIGRPKPGNCSHPELSHNCRRTPPKEYEGILEEQSIAARNNHKMLVPQSPAVLNSVQTRQKRPSSIGQNSQRKDAQLWMESQWIRGRIQRRLWNRKARWVEEDGQNRESQQLEFPVRFE